ncbi:hypothetical protein GCM10007377_11170 [Galliscardovia ingluviei]|uniref:Twitching motility protein PilT n=1 Tax=Galliscardovia ingluviei TaxID=1769422 RepID=A0A8J3AII9_9BIFI|nr:DUF4411 family protein [Galliscardovia ingluviei]GGI14485.1 hypothetical protein GCM10007377_11170 [Galliscardovia ingluviei]
MDSTNVYGVVVEQPPLLEPKYYIDTNCLITPNKDYYNPAFSMSETFWKTLKELIESSTVGIINQVYDEAINTHSAELHNWLESIQNCVIHPTQRPAIINNYRKVLSFIRSSESGYQNSAWHDWVRTDRDIADPWLIASAMTSHAELITFEQKQNEQDQPWKHLKIPTVAQHYGIHCVTLFEFMRKTQQF